MIDKIMILLIGLLSNGIYLFTAKQFLDFFLENKYYRHVKWGLVYVGGSVLLNLIYWAFHQPVLNLLANLFLYVVILTLYRARLIRKAFVLLFVYGWFVCMEILVLRNLATAGATDAVLQLGDGIVAVISLLLVLILRHFCGMRSGRRVATKYYLFLALIPASSLVLLVVTYLNSPGKIAFWIVELIAIAMLITNCVLFWVYESLAANYEIMLQKVNVEQQLKAYKSQIEILQESNRRVKVLRHDMKHHLISLRALVHQNDEKACTEYLDQMQTNLENAREFAATGNVTDGIVNYMLGKAVEKGIKVETDFRVPEESPYLGYDVSVILGNLLENAVAASERSEEKYIYLSISVEYDVLKIIVENSFTGTIQMKNGEIQSTKKEDDYEHGWGLISVRRMVERKNGTLDISFENHMFRAVVIMLEQV